VSAQNPAHFTYALDDKGFAFLAEVLKNRGPEKRGSKTGVEAKSCQISSIFQANAAHFFGKMSHVRTPRRKLESLVIKGFHEINWL
jgi:hypothetical protein